MANKMIGFYLSSFSGGGAEREMICLANEFVKRGYCVDLLVHRNVGPLSALVEKEVNKIILNRNYIYDIFYLAYYLRKFKPSLMLSSLHFPNFTLSISKILSLSRVKISWRIVINLSMSMKEKGKVLSFFYRFLYTILSVSVNNIVCVSDGVKLDFENNVYFVKKKLKKIYNPVFNSNILSLSSESVIHKWLNDKYLVVLAIGRLSPQKDFTTLIKSFAIVNNEVKNSRLLILGAGSLYDKLLDLISILNLDDVVELHGYELNPYKYLRHSDLFVLSSNYEGFGNVIVEALAFNLPVVSTDCPSGPAEILENGKWGELVPVGDTEAMSKAMTQALRRGERLATMSRAKEFSVDKVVDIYIGMLS